MGIKGRHSDFHLKCRLCSSWHTFCHEKAALLSKIVSWVLFLDKQLIKSNIDRMRLYLDRSCSCCSAKQYLSSAGVLQPIRIGSLYFYKQTTLTESSA